MRLIKLRTILTKFAAAAMVLALIPGRGIQVSKHSVPVSAASLSFKQRRHPSPTSGRLSKVSINFRDVAQAAGIDYRWEIPGKRPLNILQTIGNGCAFLDFDGDGNLDVLLVGPRLALYRGDGHGHFEDVTKRMGLDAIHGHFLGCAVGDYDNDGFPDIYISGYQTGILLHNEAGARFRDVTREAGLQPQPWGTSCGFADLDGDGYLDLYVANYVQFDPQTDLVLCREQGLLTGCGPNDYTASRGVIYRNVNGRHFVDVTRKWGANTAHGKGLGVAFADFDGTGHTGFAIANDLLLGDLFQNSGGGHLKNIGVASGTAADPTGDKHAGMGIDWGDYDNDGRFDLLVTTFGNETKCLYHNEGSSGFTYASEEARIDRPTLPYVAWGCKFFDADNDGWLDIMIANGHVQDNVRRFDKADYRQPTLFLHNLGRSHAGFEDGTAASGLAALRCIVGRGLAVGDFDNDGRVDVLVVDSEGKPLLLHNESETACNRWIGLRLRGKGRGQSNRDAYGAIVTVETSGPRIMRQCQSSGSYLSASDSRVHIGLGVAQLRSVQIRWPDGRIQKLPTIPTCRYITVEEGENPIETESQIAAASCRSNSFVP
jgi:hypothetical protein